MDHQDMPNDQGECKARKRKSTRSSDLWYKRYPARFRADTINDHQMSFELRGAWSLLVDLFYEHGGALPNDDKWIANALFCDVRKWKPIRKDLEDIGKIFVGVDGLVHNKTADEVLGEREDKLAKKASGRRPRRAKSAGTSASTPAGTTGGSGTGSGGDFSEKPNDVRGSASETALYARAIQKKEDRDSPPNPPIQDDAQSYWHRHLNPTAIGDVQIVDGQLTLVNGTRARWLSEFEGDEQQLDLAVRAIRVQPHSTTPIAAQVERKLARICRQSRQKPRATARLAAAREFEIAAFGNRRSA